MLGMQGIENFIVNLPGALVAEAVLPKKPCINVQDIRHTAFFEFVALPFYSISRTVTPRAAWAPMTRACSMSAVLEGPLIQQP